MAEKNPFPGENNTGHIWDGDLRELKNPAPRWWMIGFWASVAWWVAYGIIYPMWPTLSGYTRGVTGWTSMKEYREGLAEVEAVRGKFEEKVQGMSAVEILQDEGLKAYTQASAKVLFGDYCSACHGAGGQGNVGFPVLADDDWLYGGTIDPIVATITNGRKGIMNAHGAILQPQEVETLTQYVIGLAQGADDPTGKALFAEKGCVGCHGMDGRGMQMLGSANLTDGIWRFRPAAGETLEDTVRHTILHGVNDPSDPSTRQAEMPAFGERLSADEIKKLAVYVHELGGGQTRVD